MSIIALCIVSASEIAKVKPNFTYDWADANKEEFYDMLYQLGMDTTQVIEEQETIQHKNRLGEVVICNRWVGTERNDSKWLQSGFASQEARDKSLGNRLLNDIYKQKGMLE